MVPTSSLQQRYFCRTYGANTAYQPAFIRPKTSICISNMEGIMQTSRHTRQTLDSLPSRNQRTIGHGQPGIEWYLRSYVNRFQLGGFALHGGVRC